MPIEDPENTLKFKAGASPEERSPVPPAPGAPGGPLRPTFDRTARAFARLGVLSLALALVLRITELVLASREDAEALPLPNATHLLVVGVGGSLLGLITVREYPALSADPAGRKGVGPRVFWIFCCGLALHSVFQPLAGPESLPFFGVLSLAGLVLELVAVGMLGLSLR